MNGERSNTGRGLVEIFSKEDCHLCERAADTAKRLQLDHGFNLRIVKLHPGDPQFEEFTERFPVIMANGRFVSDFRVRESELLAGLAPLLP